MRNVLFVRCRVMLYRGIWWSNCEMIGGWYMCEFELGMSPEPENKKSVP